MLYSFFFINLLSNINTQFPKCNENSIKFKISECNEYLKRKIYFSNPEQCNIFKENIPNSNENLECHFCEKGYYLTYNISTQKLNCQKCPKNTYSIRGNFRVDGEFSEWNKETIHLFQNECFVTQSDDDNFYCSNFHTLNGESLISGNPYLTNNSNVSYGVQLGKTVHLIDNGELIFKYRKDTIIDNNIKNGIFKFYINYFLQISDSDISTSNDKYKEIKIKLNPGYYTFLWHYSKTVSNKLNEQLKIEFKNIEITGIETAALKCIPCKNGISNEGSDHCEICKDGKYFDDKHDVCLNCPIGKISYNGIGFDSCVNLPECEDNDYSRIIDNVCDIINNKQKVNFILDKKICFEKTKKNESFIKCKKCESGFFKNKINNNSYKCDLCPSNTFSNEENMDKCLKCDGIIKKILIFDNIINNTFSQEIEIVDNEGNLFIELEDNKQNNNSVIIMIDNILNEMKAINNTVKINLQKGKHNINIYSLYSNIKKIRIYNTKEGGGYKCEECPNNLKIKKDNGYICSSCFPGFYLNEEKNCIKCDENYIKISQDDEKCSLCPSFTYSNKERTQCIIYDILNLTNIKRTFIIHDLNISNEKICEIQNCVNSLIQIKGYKNDLFFLNFKYLKKFPIKNSNYSFSNEKEELKYGFIFLLKSQNDIGKIYNIGNKINYIKIVDEKIDKGIIINYIGGDFCPENSKSKIETYLFIKCKKNKIEDNIFSLDTPIFIHYDNCKYYFIWENKEICPICLSNEVTSIKSACVNFKYDIFYNEGENCVIQNPKNFITNHNFNSIDVLIKEDDIELKKIYNLNIDSKRIYLDQYVSYIYENKYEQKCQINNYNGFNFMIYIVFGVFVFFILLIILIFICIKLNKLYNNYKVNAREKSSSKSDISFEMKIVKIEGKQ